MSDLMDLAEWLQVAWSSDAKSPRWASGWRFKPTNAAMKSLQPVVQQLHSLAKN